MKKTTSTLFESIKNYTVQIHSHVKMWVDSIDSYWAHLQSLAKPKYSVERTKQLFNTIYYEIEKDDIIPYVKLLEKAGANPFSPMDPGHRGRNVFQLVMRDEPTSENKEKLLTYFLNHDKFNPEMLNERNEHKETTLNSAIIYDIRNWSQKTPTSLTQKFMDAAPNTKFNFNDMTYYGNRIIDLSIRIGHHEMTDFLMSQNVELDTASMLNNPDYDPQDIQFRLGSYWAHLESLAALEYADQKDDVESMGNLKPLTIQDFQ